MSRPVSQYQEQVLAAVRATTIHSPTVYSWFGSVSPRLPRRAQQALTAATARSYLQFMLRSQLYSDFYCQGQATPSRKAPIYWIGSARTPFLEALSSANSGRGCWEQGWQVRARDAGYLVVHRDGLSVWARPEECRGDSDQAFHPGDGPLTGRVRLHFPKELFALAPGFYMVLGDRELRLNPSETLLRLYWNLAVDGAVIFVGGITRRLNEAGVPFRLKLVNDPAAFTRCDAAVLYTHKRDWATVAEVSRHLHSQVAEHLKPLTPVFTKPLARGLGLAEDPGDGDSFGTHRCRLLADGLIRAFEQRVDTLRERLRAVCDRFQEAGVDLDTPFLNAGSHDDYRLLDAG